MMEVRPQFALARKPRQIPRMVYGYKVPLTKLSRYTKRLLETTVPPRTRELGQKFIDVGEKLNDKFTEDEARTWVVVARDLVPLLFNANPAENIHVHLDHLNDTTVVILTDQNAVIHYGLYHPNETTKIAERITNDGFDELLKDKQLFLPCDEYSQSTGLAYQELEALRIIGYFHKGFTIPYNLAASWVDQRQKRGTISIIKAIWRKMNEIFCHDEEMKGPTTIYVYLLKEEGSVFLSLFMHKLYSVDGREDEWKRIVEGIHQSKGSTVPDTQGLDPNDHRLREFLRKHSLRMKPDIHDRCFQSKAIKISPGKEIPDTLLD
ncbi:hypothetical protein M413DRAFT_10089 [Hebeloma cylindrosporum]|uniref:Uncharacterized protein n=1 Tax=Hebeloma cylindrosporum TaxID=76867 RepID=A0A0C2YNC5_HEBCY|nr:hypothetical protein M413DRAFT_10089 [Hebeloma cylindrosporum h7]